MREAGLAPAVCLKVEASPEPEVSSVRFPSAVLDVGSAWAPILVSELARVSFRVCVPALARACAQALVLASVLILARALRLAVLPPMVLARELVAVNGVVPVPEAGRLASVRQVVQTQPKLRARRLPCCHRAEVLV